jgi:DNA polymerase-3 subunit delta'
MSMTLPWLTDTEAELQRRLDQGRLAHALLIHGQPGLGKSRLARTLVKMMLPNHALIEAGTHPDYFEVTVDEEAHSAILIDQIRALSESLTMSAAMGGARVGVILDAHRMNRNAYNALLKTLEEPPNNAWLVLVTDQPARLPATIRSRCQRVQIHAPDATLGLEWLRGAVAAQQSPEAVQLALALSSNAPLAALDLLENEGLVFGQAIRTDLVALSQGGVVDAELLARWMTAPAVVWRWLATWLAHLATIKVTDGGADWPVRPTAEAIQQLWTQSLEGQRLTESSVRQELLFHRWVLHWQQACSSGR